jgi:CRISPR-associated protein Cas1
MRAWGDAKGARMIVARRMYAWRLGEVLPHRDITVLRGIEGARVKEIYRLTAERIGELWMSVQAESLGPSIALHEG